jgi:hypothetical protein
MTAGWEKRGFNRKSEQERISIVYLSFLVHWKMVVQEKTE